MLYIPNYTFVRLDRSTTTSGGGIITYIHNDIPYIQRLDLRSENVESICVEIKPRFISPILIFNVYRPPSADSVHDTCLLEIMNNMTSEHKEQYILGDFNIDLQSSKSKSTTFSKKVRHLGLKQLVTVPTRTEARYINGTFHITSTLIDHIYCSSERNVASIHIPPLSLSDHFPVFLVRRANAASRQMGNKPSIIQYRSLSNLNEVNFRNDLRSAPWSSIEAYDDPSDALAQWYQIFQSIVDRHVPLRTKKVKSLQLPKWMTSEILAGIRQRDQLKLHARSGVIPWETFTRQRNKITTQIKQAKQNYFKREIYQNKHDSRKLWKLMKDAADLNKNKATPNKILDNTDLITDPKKIANIFNSHFSQIANTIINETAHHQPNFDALRNFVDTRLCKDHQFTIPPMTAEYLFNEINNLSCHKAKGIDAINFHLLKIGCNDLLPSLLYLYNSSIASGIFPDQWKISKITPIFKKGSRQDKDNYRPISVLSVLSKIVERYYGIHLISYLTYLNDYNLLTSSQFGSRPLHSCETMLLQLTDTLLHSMDKGELSGILLVDFRKAFDLINHELLLQKLAIYGLKDATLQWFRSYRPDRTETTRLNWPLNLRSLTSSQWRPARFISWASPLHPIYQWHPS